MSQSREGRRRWKGWTMLAVVLGSGIVFLDTTVVSLALPRIAQDLPRTHFADLEVQAYIQSGYFLTLSALLILAGALTDRRGRRRMFGVGLVGFGATSLLCGLAPNAELLVVFRILQGAAGALVVPGSLAIITASFEGEEQGRAFGVWAAASGATTILGPFVGGVLVDTLSWRWAFLINVPLVLVALYATVRFVPESRDEGTARPLDWVGSLIVVIAVAGLAFGPIRGQQTNWAEPLVPVVSIALGAAAAIAFPLLMRRSPNPLVPPRLFRSRNFTVTNIATFVIYGALYVFLTFLNVFLIGVVGYNPPAAGIATIPGSLLLVAFSTRFGRLSARYGPRLFMTAGPSLMGVGLLWFLRMPTDSVPWVLGTTAGRSLLPPADYLVDVLPALLVFGAGLMMMVAPLTTALMTSLPRRNSGLASAINNAISRVGSPLVFAVIFVAIAPGFYGSIADRVPEAPVHSPEFRQVVSPLNPPGQDVSEGVREAAEDASTDAFRLSMLVAALLLFGGAAVNGLGVSNRQALEQAHAEIEPVPGLPPGPPPASGTT